MMIQPTQLCCYVVPAGLFLATEAQFITNRCNAQKPTSTRSLSMSLGNPADCFMQNKPNFRKAQMNVKSVLTEDYGKRTLGEHGKNKPNSNPIKPNFPARLFKIFDISVAFSADKQDMVSKHKKAKKEVIR
jgi:hypothetical protein